MRECTATTLTGIAHSAKLNKPQLLELVKSNKPEKKFIVDEMARSAGHDVLRLPSYHSILNPIELVWGNIKVTIYYVAVTGMFDVAFPCCVSGRK